MLNYFLSNIFLINGPLEVTSDLNKVQWRKNAVGNIPDNILYISQSKILIQCEGRFTHLDNNDCPVPRLNIVYIHVITHWSTSFFSTTSQATCKPSRPLKGISRVSISQSTCQEPRSANKQSYNTVKWYAYMYMLCQHTQHLWIFCLSPLGGWLSQKKINTAEQISIFYLFI